jgi:hypothetical protein
VAGAGFLNSNVDFSAISAGASLQSGHSPWGASSISVVVTNINGHDAGSSSASSNCVAIPVLTTLSNAVDVALNQMSNTNIWTDFWTIPRPFVSVYEAAPTVDPNSSAMFFVTGGVWAVVYGAGGETTNLCSKDIFNDDVDVVDGTAWCRVSVLHNYNTHKWSLFINGAPVKTNMGFIGNANPGDKYDWFSVQNGGGDAADVTWIDDVMVTNRVPATLTNDGDNDGLRDAWELMYYGNLAATSTTVQASGFNNDQLDTLGANPNVVSASEPGGASLTEYVFGDTTNTAFVSAAPPDVSSPNLNLTFQVVSNRLYRVLGSTTYNGVFGDPRFTFVTDASEQRVQTHTGVLASDSTNYYYRLVAETTNGGVVFRETNAITYAVHSQARGEAGVAANFWVGLTVDYGTSNTLSSTFGTQLAQGLHAGEPDEGDQVTIYWPRQTTFYLSPSGWAKYPGDQGPLGVSSNIPVGIAMVVQKLGYGNSEGTRTVFSGAMLTSASAHIPVVGTNWNMISCPYEGSNSIASLTCGAANANVAAADRVWLYRNGQYQQLRRWPSGWQFEPKTATAPTTTPWGYLQLGEGVFYYNATNASTWNP